MTAPSRTWIRTLAAVGPRLRFGPVACGRGGCRGSVGDPASVASRSPVPSDVAGRRSLRRPPRSGLASAAADRRRPHRPALGPGAVPPVRPGRRRRATARPPRLASLQLKRIDPWTVLKISLIVSIVMFFVWMIAIGVLYLSLGSMDVWTKINETYNTLVAVDATTPQPDLITPTRVFGITAVVGAINIVLFTALATIAAFVYNAAAGMAGGVELTLGERD